MQGCSGRVDRQDRGIVPRAVHMIFDTLQQRKQFGGASQVTFSVKMSCFEVYIETVKDLFNPENSQSQATNLSKWKPIEMEVNSLEDV